MSTSTIPYNALGEYLVLLSIPVEQRTRLLSESTVISVSRKTTFVIEASSSDIALVLEGAMLSHESGSAAIVSSGDFCRLSSMTNNQSLSTKLIAIENTRLLLIPHARLDELRLDSPALTLLLLKSLSKSAAYQARLSTIVGIKSLSRRIVSVLNLFMYQRPNGDLALFTPSHDVLGNLARTSRETVNRTLRTLEKTGIIKKIRAGYYTLLDSQALAQMPDIPEERPKSALTLM